MQSNSFWPNSQSWRRYWPAGTVALIAVIQFFISLAILGIQIAITVIGLVFLCNNVTARYIVGFICCAFFIACWISVFCVTCCNRSSVGCATYTLVKNILAFIFSVVLIGFDGEFIANPLFDYSPDTGYSIIDFPESTFCTEFTNTSTDFLGISLKLIKGQLAGAVIILVTSLVFVSIYVYVYIRAIRDGGRISENFFSGRNQSIPSQYRSYQMATPQMTVAQSHPTLSSSEIVGFNPIASGYHDTSHTVICHRCGATVYVSDRF